MPAKNARKTGAIAPHRDPFMKLIPRLGCLTLLAILAATPLAAQPAKQQPAAPPRLRRPRKSRRLMTYN